MYYSILKTIAWEEETGEEQQGSWWRGTCNLYSSSGVYSSFWSTFSAPGWMFLPISTLFLLLSVLLPSSSQGSSIGGSLREGRSVWRIGMSYLYSCSEQIGCSSRVSSSGALQRASCSSEEEQPTRGRECRQKWGGSFPFPIILLSSFLCDSRGVLFILNDILYLWLAVPVR